MLRNHSPELETKVLPEPSRARLVFLHTYSELSVRRKVTLACLGVATMAIVAKLLVGEPNRRAVPKEENKAVVVDTVQAKRGTLMLKVVASGTVRARDPISINSQTGGLRIKQILVEEGDWVRKGQPLAIFNTDVLKAQLREEAALLTTAKANLAKAVQPNRLEQISNQLTAVELAKTDIAQKQSALDRAQAEHENTVAIGQRYNTLYDEGGATAQEAQQKRTDVESFAAALHVAEQSLKQAKLSLIQAENRLAEMRSGGRLEDIAIARSTVEQYEARIDNIRAQIAQAIVTAPDDGLIVERLGHLGEVYSSGDILFKLVRHGKLELQAKLSQDNLQRVLPGQKVIVEGAEKQIDGTVWLLSPSVNSTSRQGMIRISLPHNAAIRVGMFLTATIFSTKQNAIIVPISAIASIDNKNSVLIVANGIVRRRTVEIGTRDNNVVEVKRGLDPGETLVSDGVAFLEDGDQVKTATNEVI